MPQIHVSPTAPTGVAEGDLWLNSGQTNPGDLQRFLGGAWRNTQTLTGAKVFSDAVTVNALLTTSQGVKAVGRQQATVSVNKTLAEGDSGVVQVVDTDGVVVTLPATVVGTAYVVENGGADGAVGISVSPAAADKIMGNGFTSADNKDAVNTKATAKKGDRIVLVADGVNGWFCEEIVGTWAREA